jgi:hypothetical protein
MHAINRNYTGVGTLLPTWNTAYRLIELAKGTRGTVAGDELVHKENVTVGLG